MLKLIKKKIKRNKGFGTMKSLTKILSDRESSTTVDQFHLLLEESQTLHRGRIAGHLRQVHAGLATT